MARGAVGLFIRGTVYWLRVIVPKDLQKTYSKTRIEESLGTSDLQEASLKGTRRRAEWLEEFEARRKALNPQKLESITPDMVQALAEAGRRGILQRDQNMREGKDGAFKALRKGIREAEERRQHQHIPRINVPNSGWPTLEELPELVPLGGVSEWEAEVVSEVNTSRLEEAQKNIARGNLLYFLPPLQSDAIAMGFTVTTETEGLKEALEAYTQSYLQALQEATQRDAGELIPTPSTPPIATAPKAAARLPIGVDDAAAITADAGAAAPGSTLMEVYGRWLKKESRTKSTEQAYKLAVAWCEQCLGKPLHLQQLTRAQGDTFRAWLQEPERKISPKTARDRLTAIKTLLRYAHRDLELIPRQPWESLDIKVKKTQTRRAWKDEELQQLFKQPLFQAYEIPEGRNAGSDAAYWIPLLGLYTGARIGELAQLRVSDITEEDGKPVLKITDEGEGQRLKTSASLRSIPIHPELTRLGLLEYTQAIQKAGHESLWPILRVSPERPGLTSTNWFGKYRRSIGLTEAYPDFHSFRHLVRTRMSKGKIPEKVQDAITGHETQGSTGTKVYQGIDLEDRIEAIQSLTYASINLPKVYTQPRMEEAVKRKQKGTDTDTK